MLAQISAIIGGLATLVTVLQYIFNQLKTTPEETAQKITDQNTADQSAAEKTGRSPE